MEGCPAQTTIDSIPDRVATGVHINVFVRSCAANGVRVIQGKEEVESELVKERVASLTASILNQGDSTYILSVIPEGIGEHSLPGEIPCLL